MNRALFIASLASALALAAFSCDQRSKSSYTSQEQDNPVGDSTGKDTLTPRQQMYIGENGALNTSDNRPAILPRRSFFKGEDKDSQFVANLNGRGETKAVKTEATGRTLLELSRDGAELRFKMTVKNLDSPMAAHIHLGTSGQDGPPVAMLWAGPQKKGVFTGTLAEGTITARDLMSDLKGKDLSALVDDIRAGKAYVNIHTAANPSGEIRGQVLLRGEGMTPKSTGGGSGGSGETQPPAPDNNDNPAIETEGPSRDNMT